MKLIVHVRTSIGLSVASPLVVSSCRRGRPLQFPLPPLDRYKTRNWKGLLCNGRSNYGGQTGGRIKNIRFKMMDGFVEITADVRGIWLRLNGSYRSDLTYCLPISGWLGMSSDWASLKANLYLSEDPEKKPVDRIQILETEFGRMHFGTWVPEYVEDVVTGFSNEGFAEVWANSIGEWLNRKISEQVKKSDALKGLGGGNG